ncbi:MAG: Asp-tRNA(Asn)/Glu-tRNA(Gln) amidotransferase subunit GatC [Firmicutes bacterium]|nr:Asp-tRNA(Asn)/Glu-tRNA(Gln) amidotransferase subunit GatC [Bacillota bacterium]
MKIDEQTVLYLQELSYLTLSAQERAEIANSLENILQYMAVLSKADTKSVSAEVSGDPVKNALRPDRTEDFGLSADILKNAPVSDGEFFIVPKVIE